MSPTAVVVTSGFPPGVSAKPPDGLSKQFATKRLQVAGSGGSPPKYFKDRSAAEVARKLGGFGSLRAAEAARAVKPPLSVCSARTYATVALTCSGVWACVGTAAMMQAQI